MTHTPQDPLQIGSLTIQSRLFLGTAQYPDPQTLTNALTESKTELVTVGIRRMDLSENNSFSLVSLLKNLNIILLPNTAGCYTAKEAVLHRSIGS